MRIKSRKLKLVFGLLATQTDEITVRSTETEWTIRAVDPSHTSMIDAKIPSTAFITYEQTNDFAVSLKNINKALANAGDECDVTITDGTFVLESEGLTSTFPQIAVAETDAKIPTIDYSAHATVTIGDVMRISNAVYGNIDAYRMQIGSGQFSVSAVDTSRNGASLTLAGDKCLDVKGEARAVFTIDMLDRFLKVLPKDTIVDISMGDDMPVEISLNDADIGMRYLLAPRIEQE